MKKKFILSCILLPSLSLFGFFHQGFDIDDFHFHPFNTPKKEQILLNKPKIYCPLPKSALTYTYYQHQEDLIDTQDFLQFLKSRSLPTHKIENEWRLIETFCSNYFNNEKNLTEFTKPIAAFCAGANVLFYHQVTAEYQCYPKQCTLTPFEQDYKFKLEPVDVEEYKYMIETIPPTVLNHYKRTILKRWTCFLLKKLIKK